jgi:hypothetical protein
MKKLLLTTLFIFMACVGAFAQAKPAKTTDAPADTASKMDAASDKAAETKLLVSIMEVELTLRLCSMVPTHESCKDRNPSAELAELYNKAAKSSDNIKVLIARAISSYSEMKEGAKSAMQVSQAADEASVKMQMIIMAQNQRIIELLEQIAKKKP